LPASILAVLVLVWVAWRFWAGRSQEDLPSASAGLNLPLPVAMDSVPVQSPTSLTVPVDSAAADTTQNPAAVTAMGLQVTAGEQSWVVIEADGDTVAARVLVGGQSLHAEAENEFRLTVTNPRGLRVELNGEPVPGSARTDRPLIRHLISRKETP
jgi:hypothetical protein